MFSPQLRNAKEFGTIDAKLFSIITLLALTWDADSQAIEGVNSRIKYECNRSHAIGLATLSSNIVITNLCNLGTREAPMKWSQVKPRADAVLEMASSCFHKSSIEAIMSGRVQGPGIARWETPPPRNRVTAPQRIFSETQRWVSACSLDLFKVLQPKFDLNSVCKGVSFNTGRQRVTKISLAKDFLAAPSSIWISPTSYHSMCYLLKLRVMGFADNSVNSLALRLQPLAIGIIHRRRGKG